MAKRDRKPKISLFPAPWETTGNTGTGTTAPLARPELIAGEADDPKYPGGFGAVRQVRVWRASDPKILKHMTSDRRMALEEYAEAVERVSSVGGASDPSGGGGGGSASKTAGPSHAHLTAADHLRRMRLALAGLEMLVIYTPKASRRAVTVRATYRQITDWIMVDGFSRAEVLRRMGVKKDVKSIDVEFARILADIGHRLAVSCGLTPPENG